MSARGAVVLVSAVGEATGSKAAAAALACAGSEPDRPGLLVELDGRPPRPTLVASSGARELEQRLRAHLPEAQVAARGQTCHLCLPDDPAGIDQVPAALALVRESVAVVHLPPPSWQAVLAEAGIRATAALLRADLRADRALTALAIRDLIARGLSAAVLKQPLAWVPARLALFGVLPPGSTGGLPERMCHRLLAPLWHECYSGSDGERADAEGTPQQERRDNARLGPG